MFFSHKTLGFSGGFSRNIFEYLTFIFEVMTLVD